MKNVRPPMKVRRIRNGDIFSIPLSTGDYGIGQIIAKEHPRGNSYAWAILFDRKFTQAEIDNIETFDFDSVDILTIAPLVLALIKHATWSIVTHRDPADVYIPMFQAFNDETGSYSIYNLQQTLYRDVPERICCMRNSFHRGGTYFTHLCELKFGNPAMAIGLNSESLETYLEPWGRHTITEDDMAVNSHLYKPIVRKWISN